MNRRHYVMVVVLGAGLGACSADPEALESVASPIVAGDLVTVDPAGYAFVANGQASGSGTFLSPQWVLTSGHVLAQFDGIFRSSFGDPPRAGAVVGTSTTNEIRGVPYAHPNYWGPLGSAGAEQEGPRDVGFDIGLIRLDTAVDGSAYPNKLYNQLSNDWPGSSLRCFGYGATSLSPAPNGSGGGRGILQTAVFPKTGHESYPGSVFFPPSSVELIDVADSASGQRLFHGDSGGGCVTEGRSPFVISGVVEGFVNHQDGTRSNYLVDPWWQQWWVDQTMHGQPTSLPTSAPTTGSGPVFTSASTKVGASRRAFVLASYGSDATQMNVNSASGWSGWAPLTALPSGLHGTVGAATLLDSTEAPKLFLAAANYNPQSQTSTMLVSPVLSPGTTSPWPSFSWISAGSAPSSRRFKGVPAVVAMGPGSNDRVDYFALATTSLGGSGAIWFRWRFNNAWQGTAWQQIPSPPGLTITGSPSVARKGGTYFLTATASDGNIWFTTLPNVTNSATHGGPWNSWTSLNAPGLTNAAVTAWDRGVDVYVVASDNTLWHKYMDGDGVWSEWIQVNTTVYQGGVLTASNLLPSIHEINIFPTVSGPSPRLIRYPW